MRKMQDRDRERQLRQWRDRKRQGNKRERQGRSRSRIILRAGGGRVGRVAEIYCEGTLFKKLL